MDFTLDMIKKEHKQNVIHFASLINLAFADNEFDIEEYELLEKFSKKLGISGEERTMILENPEAFSIGPIDHFSKRLEFIYDFFKIIYADHQLDETEYHLVRSYIQAIGFNLVNTKSILNKTVDFFEKRNKIDVASKDLSLKEYEELIFD